MDLFYGRSGSIERADTGWLDGTAVIVARAQPRAKAPGGVGKSIALGPLFVVVRHDGACRLTLTPIVSGVVRDDLAATYDFAASDEVIDEVVRLVLSDPLTMPGDTKAFSRQAVRGTWITVRAVLQPLPTEFDPPAGTVYALGEFESEYRVTGRMGASIPISGGG